MKAGKLSVLGEEWTLLEGTELEFPALKEDLDGYTDMSTRTIVIDSMELSEGDPTAKGNLKAYKQAVTRHEIIHAFLEESGLSINTRDEWARNEEMVDWFALQIPKLVKAFKAVGAL